MDGMMRALGLLWLAVTMGGATLAETMRVVRRHIGRTPAQTYFAGLRNLALVFIIAPLFLVGFAVVRDNDWFALAAALTWGVATVMIWVLASYIAVLIDALTLAGKTRSGNQIFDLKGKQYVDKLIAILLTEVCIAFVAIVIPWHGNLMLAALTILASLALALAFYFDKEHTLVRKLVKVVGIVFLLGALVYAFFPNRSMRAAEMVKDFDRVGAPDRNPTTFKTVYVRLAGEDRDSEAFNIYREVPRFWYACFGNFPAGTRVRYSDGTIASLHDFFGMNAKGGEMVFRGPVGMTVEIKIQEEACQVTENEL